MRTVTLEFLRHGPPHGHLLSPLARYMALCGSHEPSDVSVPFDHAELLTRLRALLYKDSAETRELQLAEMAKSMSQVLAAVPGLVADLADSFGTEPPQPTHLRIIFNANELALLPFELANAASAFPGAGQSLALQPQVPLCITREVRRASTGKTLWPKTPRILFAASSAGGDIPVDAHLLALRQLIEPWMWHYEERDEAEWKQRIEQHFTFLPSASVEGLLEACASGCYTHVHILAHGVSMDRDDGRHFGLALHNSQDLGSVDKVDGIRLATLLRPHVKGQVRNLARPSVVSIAACDSGNVGSVIGAGASIAHALHEAGIPLVVASQFPLSFAGSVVMTQVLYEAMMSGIDPRLMLIDVRRQLKVRVRNTHDWASVVAYAAFPIDLDAQLAKVRVARASASINAALSHADRATKAFSPLLMSSTPASSNLPQSRKLLEISKVKLKDAMERMAALLDLPLADKAAIHGLLASAYKRKAEVFWRVAPDQPDALAALTKSRSHYRQSFEADRSQSWGLVQAMVLTAAVDGAPGIDPDEMNLTRLLTIRDKDSESRNERAWAFGNALELQLLSALTGVPMPGLPAWGDCVLGLVRAVGTDGAEVHSTRRQLSRWVEFFPAVRSASKQESEEPWTRVENLAREMFDLIPEPPTFS